MGLFEFFSVGGDNERLQRIQPDALAQTPGVELAERSQIRHPRVVVFYLSGKVVYKAQRCRLAGMGYQFREVQRFRQRHRLAVRCG